MDREAKIIKLKLDVIFKRVFGNEKNDKIIAAFVEDLLEMKRGTIQKIEINNVELSPDELDRKFSRLDLKMHVDNRVVNIEMQVNYEADFKDRTLFYWSKLYSEELAAGDEYGDLKQTICINIINFNTFDCEKYQSHFKVLETDRHESLSDKLDIYFFEPNVYFEDRLFTAQVLINLKTLVTVPDIYYNYWTNPNSIVKTKSKKKSKDSQYTKEKLMKYLKENNVNLDHYYTQIKKFKFLGLTFLKIKYYKYKKELIFLNQIKFQIKN